jgi:hypothetical protein
MKYEMKHAKKQDIEKESPVSKRKAAAVTLGSIAGIAVIVLCVLNFQIISTFISSKMDTFTSWFLKGSAEGIEETADEVKDIEEKADGTEDNTGKELPEAQPGEEEEAGEEEEKEAPTIELKIYEGPTLEGSICYWRVKAVVTGDPAPSIDWNKDDSLGSFGDNIAQVNLNDSSETFTLTATATNSEGTDTASIPLSWGCNRKPEIKGISLSEDTLYVGKQYDASVDVSDPDGDTLSFSWSVTGGSIVDNTANPIKWNTPNTPEDYQISVAVSDGHGNTAETSTAAYVGEVVVEESNPTNMDIPRKEGEGGYIESGGGTFIGGDIYAGDSSSNKPCMGFVSFDISDLGGSTIEAASLKFSGVSQSGVPLSFLYRLKINVLDWGAEPITQSDFGLDGVLVASYDSPNITCNVSKLKEELQKAIDEDRSRFQIRIHFSGPYTDNDDEYDGWGYSQGNVGLNVTINQ